MKILVSAESFGYGPIATGLNVVKELKGCKEVILDFIGSGISLEQAKLSEYFKNYYVCDTFNFSSLDKNLEIFKSYNIFLSSENVNGAIFALRNGIKNTYYIDNLMWMWDKIPNELNYVKKYFISEIIPCKENYNRIGKNIMNPVFVGPIREINNIESSLENQLIINIGGAESFLLDHNLITKFYDRLINNILSTDSIEKFDSITICGGRGVLEGINILNKSNKVNKVTLSHEKYIKVMNKSSHCIMASGLGNFIETVGRNKNIMYLPAINYSQLLQIEYYKDKKFGFKVLNWPDFDFYSEIPKYIDEEMGVNLVVNNIKKYLDGDYHNLINEAVNEFLQSNQDKSFELRKKYVNSFDKNASKEIAKIIYNDNL